MKKHYVILVAGGKGKRMGGDLPKQFLLMNGKPILMHTLKAFHSPTLASPILLVLHTDLHSHWNKLCEQHKFTIPHILLSGGEERFHSVKNGLDYIFNEIMNLDQVYIAIHDAVRPLVTREFIERTFAFAEQHQIAVPALPSSDSIRIQEGNRNFAFDRKKVFRIQTPQIFAADVLKKSFEQAYDLDFTDDASVVEKAGYPILLSEGDIRNIKITFPADLTLANRLDLND